MKTRCLLLALPLLLLVAAPARADSVTGSAQVVGGDVAAARAAAMKDAIWNAGMASSVSVATRSSNIAAQQRDAIVVTQRDRLERVKLENEAIEGGQLTLKLSFDRATGEARTCEEDGVAMGNVAAVWLSPRPTSPGFRNTDALDLVRTRLAELLRNDARGWLAGANTEPEAIVFRLALSLVSEDGGWLGQDAHKLHYDVLGPDEQGVAAGDIDLGTGRLARLAKYGLGYADLARFELNATAETALRAASKSLAAMLRCLPPVARVRVDAEGRGALRLGSASRIVAKGSLLLFARDFPVGPGGELDLTAIDGSMRVEERRAGVATLKLLGTKMAADAAGYVVFY